MKIVFVEQITDRTFKISIDFTGYMFPDNGYRYMYGARTREQLDALIAEVGLRRISWWRHNWAVPRKQIKITHYWTYVIKD